MTQYIRLSGATILRAYTLYRPLRVFLTLGLFLILLGCIPGLRFLYLMATGQGVGHVQSLILAAILLVVGFQVVLIGLVADLMSFNHKILEEVVYRLRKLDLAGRTGTGATRRARASNPLVPRVTRDTRSRTDDGALPVKADQRPGLNVASEPFCRDVLEVDAQQEEVRDEPGGKPVARSRPRVTLGTGLGRSARQRRWPGGAGAAGGRQRADPGGAASSSCRGEETLGRPAARVAGGLGCWLWPST